MITLAITSSTASVGVAIGREVTVLSAEQQDTDRRHAEELTPMIQRVLASSKTDIDSVDRLAVDVGPGRFTGLRVGVATARALALTLDIPIVPLTSLEILAAAEPEVPILAVVDARRREVFQQLFPVEGSPTEPLVGLPQDVCVDLDGVTAVGDGVDRYPDVYEGAARLGRKVQAEVMIGLAAQRPGKPGTSVEPLYLREPDVNVNIKTRG